MTSPDRKAHGEAVYAKRAENEVNWFQKNPAISFGLITGLSIPKDAALIGSGASRFLDRLVEEGFSNLSALDIADHALERAPGRGSGRARPRSSGSAADITAWMPQARYRLWHDRAVFHFLTEAQDRAAYRKAMSAALEANGYAIITAFAPDGPERCSGLPVMRYASESLAAELSGFRRIETVPEEHRTPGGAVQRFQYSCFVRI